MLLEKMKQDIRYLEYIPKQRTNDKLPLLVYLHGAGERGNELQTINTHGPIKEMLGSTIASDFIVVAPQCEESKTWWDYAERLYAFLIEYLADPLIVLYRVRLVGLGTGGVLMKAAISILKAKQVIMQNINYYLRRCIFY